jgi:hypothetical protein
MTWPESSVTWEDHPTTKEVDHRSIRAASGEAGVYQLVVGESLAVQSGNEPVNLVRRVANDRPVQFRFEGRHVYVPAR